LIKNKISFLLFTYSGGNGFYIDFKFKDILNFNFKKMCENYALEMQIDRIIEEGFLPKYSKKKEQLSNEDKRLIMLNIFNKKIQYHRERRNKFNHN
jgi:hypothetical protein